MPLRWKIFLVFNFVLSIPALIAFIFMLVNFLNARYYSSEDEYLLVFVPLFALLMITINGLLNIFMLQKYFPDKLLPVAVRRVNVVSLVLNSIIALGILALCIYAASYEFGEQNEYERQDPTGRIVLAILFVLWLVQVVILIMQGQLPGHISRNNRAKMNSLIDSIGQ